MEQIKNFAEAKAKYNHLKVLQAKWANKIVQGEVSLERGNKFIANIHKRIEQYEPIYNDAQTAYNTRDVQIFRVLIEHLNTEPI